MQWAYVIPVPISPDQPATRNTPATNSDREDMDIDTHTQYTSHDPLHDPVTTLSR